jgi:hypothetical protein
MCNSKSLWMKRPHPVNNKKLRRPYPGKYDTSRGYALE